MELKTTNADIDYLRKYVNFGNKIWPVKDLKRNSIGLFIIFPLLGILIASSDWMNSAALRIIYLVIMVAGIVLTLVANKLFSGNRDYLFNVGFGIAGLCAVCFMIGIFTVYGVSKFLFVIFIIIQVAVIIIALMKAMKYIADKRSPAKSVKQWKFYGLGGCIGYFGAVIFSKLMVGVDADISRIIIAALFMVVATLPMISIDLFVQLHYAVKYKIEIINTWDIKRDDVVGGKQ